MDPQRTINLIISITVFGLVVSVWCIGVFLWLGRYLLKLKSVQRRLGISAGSGDEDSETLRLWRDLQIRQAPEHVEEKETVSLHKKLNHWITDAGWKVPFRAVVLGVCGLALMVFVVVYNLFGGIMLAICGIFVTYYLFLQYVQNRIIKRVNLFERQLVDALGVAARALRAGHPLVGAFQLIAEEIGDPLGGIFRQVYQEQAFGSDLKDSLKKAAKENRNTEFKLFATSVTVQMHSGGNLADLMDTLSSVIRSRIWLNKRIRVLTAQTQFSKMVLIAMPILMFFVLSAVNPDYMEPLHKTLTGNFLLLLGFVMLLLGSWVMNKMAKIDF
ncbi:MAG: type II secretion system F family protein [Planctomycetales bacterium]|nr:type II secretion system F family protein [Planctomycetales bacterium]